MRWFCVCAALIVLGGCSSAAKEPTASGPKPPIVHPIRAPRPMDELEKAPLYTFNEREVDAYLRHLQGSEPNAMARIMHLARKEIGQPYAIFLLGEYPYELYDPDPMYCLDKSDCVTFVEHMYAMGLSKDWQEFFMLLQRLRYNEGKVGMITRNHEGAAVWNPANAWMFDEVSASLGDGKQSLPMHMTWRPSKFFAQFGIGQDEKDVVLNSVYIPATNVANVLKDIRTGDIIQIVRGNAKEQYVGHFGLAVRADDGAVDMIHSSEPRVREQGILNYVEKNAKKTLGIKVLRAKGEMQKLAEEQRYKVTMGG
jgi:hypothetical protein